MTASRPGTPADAAPPAPLAGIRVLSLAENYPGPYATMILADLGADVVLVERPAAGDPARGFPIFHEAINRNKRSIVLDLKSPGGAATFLRIAATVDVVIEGFRPGVASRLRVGAQEVAAVNPGAIYASISGFGQSGPHRSEPAHDVSLQAMAGLLEDRLGAAEPGDPPSVGLADVAAALFAVIGIVSALVQRQRTSLGTTIDVGMLDGLISLMTPAIFASANQLGRSELPPDEPGYGLFPTADGDLLSISITHEDHFWVRLCDALGLADVSGVTADGRARRFDELRQLLRSVIRTRDCEPLVDLLVAAGVPCARVLRADDVAGSAQVRDRGLLVEVPASAHHPDRRHVRQPIVFAGEPTEVSSHVPRLGEHTESVLRGAGFSDQTIGELRAAGVVN